jgi:hypothetical protein
MTSAAAPKAMATTLTTSSIITAPDSRQRLGNRAARRAQQPSRQPALSRPTKVGRVVGPSERPCIRALIRKEDVRLTTARVSGDRFMRDVKRARNLGYCGTEGCRTRFAEIPCRRRRFRPAGPPIAVLRFMRGCDTSAASQQVMPDDLVQWHLPGLGPDSQGKVKYMTGSPPPAAL